MFFLAILPALGWGLMPVLAALNKGKPSEQLLGTTTAALLFGWLFFLVSQPAWSLPIFAVSFLSGIFWGIGQYLQFYSFQDLPISEAMPISNGTQLIGTTLVAAIFFQEWENKITILLGTLSLVVIIVGIYFTNYKEQLGATKQKSSSRPIFMLLLSSCALTVYVVLPQFFGISGAVIIFPQAIGMFTISVLINIQQLKQISYQKVAKNFSTGIAWSIANLSLFLIMPEFGVSKSFTLSQLAVLVSLFTGILIFHQVKTKKESWAILCGAFLITVGILVIGLLKS